MCQSNSETHSLLLPGSSEPCCGKDAHDGGPSVEGWRSHRQIKLFLHVRVDNKPFTPNAKMNEHNQIAYQFFFRCSSANRKRPTSHIWAFGRETHTAQAEQNERQKSIDNLGYCTISVLFNFQFMLDNYRFAQTFFHSIVPIARQIHFAKRINKN